MITIANEKQRIDFSPMRAEYIAGGTSYRKLAKKYGVSATCVGAHARSEGWAKERAEVAAISIAKTIQKTADIAAENAVRAQRIKSRLLEKLETLMEAQLKATEERQYDGIDRLVAINRLRDLTAAYKDLTGDMPRAEAGEETLQQAREILGGVDSVIE